MVAMANKSVEMQLEECASAFRMLADATRLRIFLCVCQKERSVGDIARMLNLRQPTVSHHLGLLRLSGLVQHRRIGKQVYYVCDGAMGSGAGAARSLVICGQQFEVQIMPTEAAQRRMEAVVAA